ncbi:MAG: hypothetical protein COB41_09400 [Proteobacteria bacterium]|nr:MAG: hypothetical protein COB41_09400 [Pseudomonadota bacterium]
MQKIHFPYLALPLALIFMLIITIGSEINAAGITRIPLLSLLIMNEFAFFITAAATYIGIKHIQNTGLQTLYGTTTILCFALTVSFIFLGLKLWPA